MTQTQPVFVTKGELTARLQAQIEALPSKVGLSYVLESPQQVRRLILDALAASWLLSLIAETSEDQFEQAMTAASVALEQPASISAMAQPKETR